MQRLTAYLFLLLHLNTGIFIPDVQETELHDKYGRVMDDVNSALEYTVQEVFGYDDPSPEDEDDNQPCFYQQVSVQYYIVSPPLCYEDPQDHTIAAFIYPESILQKLQSVPLDILTPPPNQA